jgi:hypothetical protein
VSSGIAVSSPAQPKKARITITKKHDELYLFFILNAF